MKVEIVNGKPAKVVVVQVPAVGPKGDPGDVAGGESFMQTLIYDPAGVQANVFDASNLTGNIDGGTFA